MASCNRVNGTHVSENSRLLTSILREAWVYDGLVTSDWLGTYSTAKCIKAGLDLEMPGPTMSRGNHINQALTCGKLSVHHLDDRVSRILQLIQRVSPRIMPESAEETEANTPETATQLRKLASDGIVLLKNNNSTLTLDPSKTIAVVGPNAAFAAHCGGGSASLRPYYTVSPFEGEGL
jgi:beta-glucosidase